MAQAITDCGHDDMIHDIALDSSGKRLATCSSDKTINIHEIDQQGTQRLLEKLKGHEGAVWSVGWAPQEYGSILASASYDAKVFIWREQGGQWQRIFDSGLHKASVNCVDWAPYESGCLLACASSDGHVSVLEFKDNNMSHLIIPAHGSGVNSVSWAPAVSPGSIATQSPNPSQPQTPQRRFVTGGCDNLLRIWSWDPASQTYQAEPDVLAGHTDWVRDVDWSPTVLQKSYIASASQDKTVRIWTKDAQSTSAQWECKVLTFDAVMWHVEWSPTGNVLAVGSGDNKVSLWNENLRGEWQCIKTADE